jgi:hypothetical protein
MAHRQATRTADEGRMSSGAVHEATDLERRPEFLADHRGVALERGGAARHERLVEHLGGEAGGPVRAVDSRPGDGEGVAAGIADHEGGRARDRADGGAERDPSADGGHGRRLGIDPPAVGHRRRELGEQV